MLQTFRNSLINVLLAAPIAIAFEQSVASAVSCRGQSMQPTLNPQQSEGRNDLVIIDRWTPRVRRYFQKGDVVLVRHPSDGGELVMKRVIALEGSYVMPHSSPTSKPSVRKWQRVPKGHCWIEGDNKDHSVDSRTAFGPLPLALIEGVAVGIAWPLQRLGQLPPSPNTSQTQVLQAHDVPPSSVVDLRRFQVS